MTWDRLLWGIEFRSLYSEPSLTCMPTSQVAVHFSGEPARAWLFRTRKEARAACAERHAFYATYPDGHVCRDWRYAAVRVRETVRKVKRKR
jgi:hypothetical protein